MRFQNSLIVGIVFAVSMFAADPHIGVWKINLEKSKLRNPAALKGAINTIEPVAGKDHTYRVILGRIGADGQMQKREDIRTYDGKERPSTMDPNVTEISERINERTRRTIFKKDGKETQIVTSTLSQDGKQVTVVGKTWDDKGNPIEETRVFDKQ
jgi:hypothetical protein